MNLTIANKEEGDEEDDQQENIEMAMNFCMMHNTHPPYSTKSSPDWTVMRYFYVYKQQASQ